MRVPATPEPPPHYLALLVHHPRLTQSHHRRNPSGPLLSFPRNRYGTVGSTCRNGHRNCQTTFRCSNICPTTPEPPTNDSAILAHLPLLTPSLHKRNLSGPPLGFPRNYHGTVGSTCPNGHRKCQTTFRSSNVCPTTPEPLTNDSTFLAHLSLLTLSHHRRDLSGLPLGFPRNRYGIVGSTYRNSSRNCQRTFGSSNMWPMASDLLLALFLRQNRNHFGALGRNSARSLVFCAHITISSVTLMVFIIT